MRIFSPVITDVYADSAPEGVDLLDAFLKSGAFPDHLVPPAIGVVLDVDLEAVVEALDTRGRAA